MQATRMHKRRKCTLDAWFVNTICYIVLRHVYVKESAMNETVNYLLIFRYH